MNDKIIIKTISTIYFSIVSFFVFIFLVLISLFIVLKNGLYLDEVSLPHLKVKQLYIKWNEKIDLSIEKVFITNTTSTNQKFNSKDINNYLNELFIASDCFDSIIIEKIKFNNINATFKYKKDENSFLVVSSKDFKLKTNIYLHDNYMNITIDSLNVKQKHISLHGSVYLNLENHQLFSKLYFNINDELKSNIYLLADRKQLKYKLESLQNIKSIKYIVSLAHLPKEVKYWVLDAIKMQGLEIKSFHGYINYKQAKESLKNLYVLADIHKLDYTYNPKLDAIHTKHTELEFQNGILYIRPKEAYSYHQFLGKSNLNIDFTKKEELLNLHLLFDGILNKDMLNILDTYKIKLPFLQKKGQVATNLFIKVGLRNINVDAKGDFFVKKGFFHYLGLDVNVKDVHVELNNYDVVVKNMQASYQDVATANIDVLYNAHSSQGKVTFRVKKVQTSVINLKSQNKPLLVTYIIQKDLDKIDIAPSQWTTFENHTIFCDAVKIPFNLKDLKLKIPTTYLQIQGLSSAYVTGDIDIKHMIVNLDTDLLSFKYANIKLDQSLVELKINYDKKFSITSKEKIIFDLDGTPLEIDNLALNIIKNVINLKETQIKVGNFLQAKINAKYDEAKNIKLIKIKNLKIKNNNTSLYNKKELLLNIKNTKKFIEISSKELDAKLNIYKKRWSLIFKSLKKISNNSEQLKQLKITNGTLAIRKFLDNENTNFTAIINYPYKIFTKGKTEISRYTIKGDINNKNISLNINNVANVNIKENIKIKIKNIGINIHELIKLTKEINSHTNSPNKSKNINLIAHNSFLDLGHNRKAIADTISLQYFHKILTAQLKYKKGLAGFKLEGDKFHLYGQNFNDEFMGGLFTLSKFKGGSLKFSMEGSLEQYRGVFYISKTIMLDYVVMNNILAFVNTIPSLTTFSVPGYNQKGLYVKEAYMNFTANNGRFDIPNLYLGSKEISITGKGNADINKDTIDIDLILKTDLGSSASKIPIVGYIVLGKDNISTGMKISGKLSNPKVSSQIIQDIVVAPLNIIKRTLLYPYKLFQDLTEDKNSSK